MLLNPTGIKELHGNWLQRLMEDRLDKVFCGRIHCTTCGGAKAWDAVRQAAARERHISPRALGDAELNAMILLALHGLDGERLGHEAPAFVVFLLTRSVGWSARGNFAGTWVGGVLEERAMIDARRDRRRRAREADEHPDAVRARKIARFAASQAAHAERLEAQRQRSQQWHADHPNGPPPHHP